MVISFNDCPSESTIKDTCELIWSSNLAQAVLMLKANERSTSS